MSQDGAPATRRTCDRKNRKSSKKRCNEGRGRKGGGGKERQVKLESLWHTPCVPVGTSVWQLHRHDTVCPLTEEDKVIAKVVH